MLLHGHKGKVSRHRRWFYEYEDAWENRTDAFLQAVSQQRLGHGLEALPRGKGSCRALCFSEGLQGREREWPKGPRHPGR